MQFNKKNKGIIGFTEISQNSDKTIRAYLYMHMGAANSPIVWTSYQCAHFQLD